MNTKNIAPSILHTRLTHIEVDGAYAPDFRRLMRDERQALGIALQSGDAARIAAARAETLRVCTMWGVEIADTRVAV